MRGTLTKIIVDAAKAEGVEYRYGYVGRTQSSHTMVITDGMPL